MNRKRFEEIIIGSIPTNRPFTDYYADTHCVHIAFIIACNSVHIAFIIACNSVKVMRAHGSILIHLPDLLLPTLLIIPFFVREAIALLIDAGLIPVIDDVPPYHVSVIKSY